MKEEETGAQNRELYALLHISPEASDEEIRKAYRQWAQIYHPDKYQALEVFTVHYSLYFYFFDFRCMFWYYACFWFWNP